MRHAFLALTNPSPGREAEFNAWYDTYHLKQVIRYGTGLRGGRRFRLADTQRRGQPPPPWRYLAWYDLEQDDLAAYHRQPWRVNPPPLKPFTGLIAEDYVGWIFTPTPPDPPASAAGCPRGDHFLFMALTNAGEGREAVFNAWYDERHLPEIVSNLEGFIAGRRYRAAAEQTAGRAPPPWRYLATYAVEADCAAVVHKAAEGVQALTRAPAGALDPDHVAWLFEPIGRYLAA